MRFAFCDGRVYKVRLLERMVTVIALPPGRRRRGRTWATATSGFCGAGAAAGGEAPRMGVDTDLVVYGESGTTYPFYLRAEASIPKTCRIWWFGWSA